MWRTRKNHFDPKCLIRLCTREIERNKKRLVFDTYAPNFILIELDPAYFGEIEPLIEPLVEQLTRYLADKVSKAGFLLLGERLEIEIRQGEDTGKSGIRISSRICQSVSTTQSEAPVKLVPLGRIRVGG